MQATSSSVASPPFDKAEADSILLQSCDAVLFHVSKTLLTEASPFFRDMFSLEQPHSGSAEPIGLPEDSEILELLLRICYGATDSEVKDIPTIERVLEAARKYQLREAKDVAKNWIWSHLLAQPLEVYAFACRYNLEHEASGAASIWKTKYAQKFRKVDSAFAGSVDGASYVRDMDDISSGAYFRLLQFVRSSSEVSDWRPFTFCRPQFSSAYRNAQRRIEEPPRAVPASLFPESYAQSVDFVLKSTDDLEFRVHRLVIELAGGKALLDGALEMTSDGLPLCRIGAIGWVLASLIQLCYPLGAPGVFQDLSAAQEILRVGTKYAIAPVMAMGKAQLCALVSTAPLRIYFIAAENGWVDLAEQAACALATQHIEDMYVPEMENVSARAYYRLLRYHHECRTAIHRVASRHSDYVQGWKAASQGKKKNLASLTVPLPIVEMWTQKLLAAQCPRPSDHRAAPVVHHRRSKHREEEAKPLVTLDLQADYLDATHAMEADIREELMQVKPRLDEP